ncbi:hypothetical protein KUCAC02_029875, partial [Chaenocephalus aceratus]
MFIFPRVRFKDSLLNGSPAGSIGHCTKSGWMNEDAFLIFLKHFIRHTNCSTDHPVLLILDNHESHISLKDIFPEEDYSPSMVTDRANPEDEPSATADLPGEEPSTSAAAHLPGPSHEPTHVTADPDPGEPPATLTNPEHLSKESSTTNDEAEDGLEKTHSREKERAEKKKRSGNKKGALKGSKPTKPKKKVLSSSSEESDFPIPLSDATHYESSDVQSDDDDGDKDLSAGDFVIVKFA